MSGRLCKAGQFVVSPPAVPLFTYTRWKMTIAARPDFACCLVSARGACRCWSDYILKRSRKNPYVLQEKLRSKITFCQGMWGITCKQNQQTISCLKSFEDGYFWDGTIVDCCIYRGVTGYSWLYCQGRWIYIPWSWWHKDPPKSQYLTLRRLMSYIYIYIYIYIYGAPILDVSRSHTTTQHSR